METWGWECEMRQDSVLWSVTECHLIIIIMIIMISSQDLITPMSRETHRTQGEVSLSTQHISSRSHITHVTLHLWNKVTTRTSVYSSQSSWVNFNKRYNLHERVNKTVSQTGLRAAWAAQFVMFYDCSNWQQSYISWPTLNYFLVF